jgi:hypothetical protein
MSNYANYEHSNGPAPLEIATDYRRRGFCPIPVPYGEKGPKLTGWNDLRPTDEDLPELFAEEPSNIGIVLGEASGGRVDVDLDCAEALQLAQHCLPHTRGVFGRASKPRSHWLYVACPPPRTSKFIDPLQSGAGSMLLELRSTGAQTIFPPSVHPSGESIEFDLPLGEPEGIEGAELLQCCARLAAAALLTRYWPEEGIRQDAALALAGGLLRAGWQEHEVDNFIYAVANVAGDEEAHKRAETAVHTARKLNLEKPVTGWPRLAELLGPQGDAMVRKVREWLGVRDVSSSSQSAVVSAGGAAPSIPSHATRLMALAAEAELFHTPDGQAYATIPIGEHLETHALASKAFATWLARRFYETENAAAGRQAIQDALTGLDGKARFDGVERPIFTRLAEHNGAIYLDLANADWTVVEINAASWRVATNPPVRFRRPKGMLALPAPVEGGSIDTLSDFANVQHDDWPLVVAWLVAALQPHGPYPILALHGEQGSAKSTTARVLRALVDPNTAPLRAEPRGEHDLMISATNNWVVTLDNLSRIPAWLSDALCRLATGGGFSTRELYSDAEEALFDAQRPIILNGIEELTTRSDLLDRALILDLPAIPANRRRSEAEFWEAFEAARPKILGALLDAVSGALGKVKSVTLAELPRLADFALWATAAEPALGWEPGAFMAAYSRNREVANALALEASPLVSAVQTLVSSRQWDGPPNKLLKELEELARGDGTFHYRGFPQTPQALSKALRRLAPNLRMSGIDAQFPPGRRNGRRILLRMMSGCTTSSPASSPPLLSPNLSLDLAS